MTFDNNNIIYEIDINLGALVKNTTLNNNYMLTWRSIINFPNKLISAFSYNDDLLLIDYYNSKMELNFTEILTINGIDYDSKVDMIADLKLKNNMREFMILTTTHRIFSLYIYDRINNDPIKYIFRELCTGEQRRLFIPYIRIDFQNSDEFFGAFLQPNSDNTKFETWIGLFSTVSGDCSLRYIINKFPE